jgi:apolipoprotein N-acyltransferase
VLIDYPVEEFAARQPWMARLLAFLTGALTMLSFAPAGWYLLALLLVLPLLYVFYRCSPRCSAELGFCYGAGLFLTGTYWLYVSIHVFGEAPLILAIFLMIALVIIMACYYAATGWLISRLAGRRPGFFVVTAPAAWVLFEWLRGWFLSGFPWMTLGYAQIDSPLAGYAPLLGIFGVSVMLMLSAGAVTMLLAGPPQWRLLLAAIAVAPWLGGVLLGPVEWTAVGGAPVRTTIVQGGVSQDRKWLPEQFSPTLNLYSQSLAAHEDSDLIVWPEVAIPSVLDRVEATVQVLESAARTRGTTLLFGILERDAAGENIYNSVVAVDGSRRQVYRKRHLVPFGEYFPVPDFVRAWMRMMNLPYSDISAGSATQPLLDMRDGNRLSVAICYEDAYAAEQRYALPDATILINVSNDAWFGDSIAPHQHLQIARMRALEAGRYVVRATNNGISAFIGPRGELIEAGPQFEYVTMTYDVEPRTGATPYVLVGNWPVIALCTLLLLAAGWVSRSRKS